LKPENILLGEAGQVKIGDFGIAQILDTADGQTKKGDGGTKFYIPPEYFSGKASCAGDIWAVGCILHEIICGKRTFEDTGKNNS